MSLLAVNREGEAAAKHIVGGCYGCCILGGYELHLQHARPSGIQRPGTINATCEAGKL